MFRTDPGPCPICGTAHSACTADAGPIAIEQLPARDALAAAAQPLEPPAELVQPIADVPATFSTSEYSRAKHGPKVRR